MAAMLLAGLSFHVMRWLELNMFTSNAPNFPIQSQNASGKMHKMYQPKSNAATGLAAADYHISVFPHLCGGALFFRCASRLPPPPQLFHTQNIVTTLSHTTDSVLLRLILRHFRHEIRWCFAVSYVFRKMPGRSHQQQPAAAAAVKIGDQTLVSSRISV